MDVHKMTDIEIYEFGVELLIDKLGPCWNDAFLLAKRSGQR